MFVLQFLLTQLFRGLVYVAHILRFRRHVLKSHQAAQITAGQDSSRTCGLAGNSSVYICDPPPRARQPHYWITIWQMSVWWAVWTKRSLSLSRLWGYLCLNTGFHLALIFATFMLLAVYFLLLTQNRHTRGNRANFLLAILATNTVILCLTFL